MNRRSLGAPVVWLWLTSVRDAMKVVRVRIALACLSETVAGIEVVVEEVEDCWLVRHGVGMIVCVTCTDVETRVELVDLGGEFGAPDPVGGERRRGRPCQQCGDEGRRDESGHGTWCDEVGVVFKPCEFGICRAVLK